MAPTYDQVGFRYFSHFGKRLVELTGIPEKAKVLDIATGRGASLFPASQKVGSEGYVIGIDLAEGMVNRTGNAIKKLGIANAKVVQMDAENLTYHKDTFDIVLCGLSIFFFPRYDIALREAHRVLKPEGKIGISTIDQQCPGQLTWIGPLIQKYKSQTKETKTETSTKDPGFGTVEGMRNMLSKAGFREIYHETEEEQFACRSAEELWDHLWSIFTRATLEKLSPACRTELKEELKIKYGEYSQDNVLYNTLGVLFTFGKK